MRYRLLSAFGFVAHIGDAITSPFRRAAPYGGLVAGTARIPGALIVGILLGGAAVASLVGAAYADANRESTSYSFPQLSSATSRGGRDYAAVTGKLYPYWVDETSNGKYSFTYYLLGGLDTTGARSWIVVRSGLPEAKMKDLLAPDGTLTLTGMLSNDSAAVSSMLQTLGSNAPGEVDPALVLDQGKTPLPPGPLYALAAICTLIGLILLVGWIGTLFVGYVVFRGASSRTSPISAPGSGFLPVRVTGLISGYANGKRARELRAQLQVPPTDPNLGPPPIELAWQTRRSGQVGIRLTPGLTRIVMGTAFPVTGTRPAIEARFGRYDIVLSFDSEVARDAAFDQVCVSAGMIASPDGASAFSPPPVARTGPAGPTGWRS